MLTLCGKAHFKEKESLVIFPETGSKNASFRQQSVGGPTSYLIPTTFTDSWSCKFIVSGLGLEKCLCTAYVMISAVNSIKNTKVS